MNWTLPMLTRQHFTVSSKAEPNLYHHFQINLNPDDLELRYRNKY